jgi:hypothetical protein
MPALPDCRLTALYVVRKQGVGFEDGTLSEVANNRNDVSGYRRRLRLPRSDRHPFCVKKE